MITDSLFAPPPEAAGYRLHQVELYNWGTFNGRIWQIKPEGRNVLLTGANGSGKTTLVDALTTLLTPAVHRHYNQSAGAERKRERTEDSYVRGAFGSIQDADTQRAQTQYLRPGRDHFSWLSAVFYNKELEQYITIAQYRRFSGDDLNKNYIIVKGQLSLDADKQLSQVLSGRGRWKQYLEEFQNAEIYSSFDGYAQALVSVFGLQSEKGLSLFAQTVGLKVLDNLTSFIRTHMLSEGDAERHFQKLYQDYQTLLEIFYDIQMAREQLRLLEPIVTTGKEYAIADAELKSVRAAEEALPIFSAWQIHEALKPAISSKEKQKQELGQQLIISKEETERLQQLKDQLQGKLNESGLEQALASLRSELSHIQVREREKQEKHLRYNSIAEQAGLPRINTNQEFASNRDTANQTLDSLKKEISASEEKTRELFQQKRTIEEEIKESETTIAELARQPSLIPAEQLRLRAMLSQKLGMEESELPFAGELLQVKDSEKAWLPALEKLLHSFALELLVPERCYTTLSSLVNEHNLRAKLVYRRAFNSYNLQGDISLDSALTKLKIKPDSKFQHWLESHLHRHYDHVCTNDMAMFRDTKIEKVLSITGQIKNKDRHEKDDRPARTGAQHYLLGWNNLDKLNALRELLLSTQEELEKLEKSYSAADEYVNKLRKREQDLTRILDFTSFDEVAWQEEKQRLEIATSQIAELEKASSPEQALRKQVDQLSLKLKDLEVKREQMIRSEGQLDSLLGILQRKFEDLERKLRQRTDEELQESRIKLQPFIDSQLILSLTELENLEEKLREEIKKEERSRFTKVTNLGTKLSGHQTSYRKPDLSLRERFPKWEGETTQLSNGPDALPAYIEKYKKLKEESLPQYEKRFNELLKSELITTVHAFHEKLDQEFRQVRKSIEELNGSLSTIEYNELQKTFIRLECQEIRDKGARGIAAFRQRLKQALPDEGAIALARSQELEDVFATRIEPLLKDLNEDENWRARVIDVRNWMEFNANELTRQEPNLSVRFYSDSQGLSGGEKAKLAYTVLASALAYNYGITRTGRKAHSFRFVVVDEAFSKSDSNNARYLMELFNRLHLQLMVVTPLDKIQVARPFVRAVHYVKTTSGHESEVITISVEEYDKKVSERLIGRLEAKETEIANLQSK